MKLVRTIACILLVLSFEGMQIRAQEGGDATISASERAWVASKLYSSIQTYFAHWEAVPNLDLDGAYREYLQKAMTTDNRLQFDLASMEFIARLKNGHSDFYDNWLYQHEGEPVGFVARKVQDKWIVTQSRIESLDVGDVIKALDDRPAHDFFRDLTRYISASDETAREYSIFYYPFLFPESFKITLENGKQVRIDRKHQKLRSESAPAFQARMLEGEIGYLLIPTFGTAEVEEQAVAFLKAHTAMHGLIIDVRLNRGGNTPNKLIRALMDRSSRNWNESTSLSIGLFAAYAQVASKASEYGLDAEAKTYMGAFQDYFSRPRFVTTGSLVQPDHPIYKGPLAVLVGEDCESACEDFLMPLKTTGRAAIIGQKTMGTSGQPFLYDFANGMVIRISSKRMYFPDGTQFEGVGIMPDVEINRTIADWKSGKDPELDRALQLEKGH